MTEATSTVAVPPGEGAVEGRTLVRVALLLTLLVLFVVLKLREDPPVTGHFRADATTYYLVARSVANGEGLRTPVSLYHQGLRDLPALSPIYPLWPLVLGAAGSVIGLERAAALLPELFYFADLLLVYALGNGIAAELRRRRGSARLPAFDLGHLAVLLLGTNPEFFKDTSLCLSEALAFCTLLAALLALPRAVTRPGWAALAGVLGGLSYLTRSQFLLVPIALSAALVLADRGARGRRSAALAAAGAALVVLPWVVYLAALPGPFEARMLVDFTAYRETPGLPRFSGYVEHGSLLARLTDVLSGVVVAFAPLHPQSYVRLFGAALYLVPLALGGWLFPRLRRPGPSSSTVPSSPLSLGTLSLGTLSLGTGATALASLLPVHLMHGNYPVEWFFWDRHGLPMFLGIVLAAGYWLARPGLAQLAVLALVAVTVWARNPLASERQGEGKRAGIWPGEQDLVAWLDAHERPPLAVSPRCRELALWSSARFHWIGCSSPAEETRTLLRTLPIDYLIVYSDESDCAFHQGLEGELELVKEFRRTRRTIAVYRWAGR